jgi:hypothetical protein
VELQFFLKPHGVTNKKGFLLKIFLQSMKFMNIFVELGFKRKKNSFALFRAVKMGRAIGPAQKPYSFIRVGPGWASQQYHWALLGWAAGPMAHHGLLGRPIKELKKCILK